MKDTHYRDWLVQAIEDSGYPPRIMDVFSGHRYAVHEFFKGSDGEPVILVRPVDPSELAGPAQPSDLEVAQ